ncbi:protein of unknown function [Legionella hackeliae]|uniref:Uncharacterized protein n=1 Tax=Legionella hackeliae TaxID=449 RepID=A0A0A8UUP9_LEGHA|nr:protein of unknown function [Legionella hackeliae]
MKYASCICLAGVGEGSDVAACVVAVNPTAKKIMNDVKSTGSNRILLTEELYISLPSI